MDPLVLLLGSPVSDTVTLLVLPWDIGLFDTAVTLNPLRSFSGGTYGLAVAEAVAVAVAVAAAAAECELVSPVPGP